ncbi:MAG TPA: alpha/beta hydrolase fold domain-containing protein, partial [Erysipelotrichaceae bacterium]|nr:alpha/beta hydrolase fold domain-containing protein [Erysipelotrichaceae bacterium]
MLNIKLIEPTATDEEGLEIKTAEHYYDRFNNPVNLSYIGPIIKGIDVGKLRYKDLNIDYPTVDLCSVSVKQKDYDLGGYRIRYFRPEHLDKPAPVVFFIHGGAYCCGTIDRYNLINRRLAELIDGVVIHIDYTLSPETGFPTALRQSYHAIEYVAKNADRFMIDPDKIAIMGDSAGAHCCAALALEDRKKRYIKMIIMYYPVLDMSDYSYSKFDISYFGKNFSPMLEARIRSLTDISYIKKLFLQNNEDPKDELISPLLAENLSAYPYTLMFCAEYDFLTIQCEEF